jgi:hypothetical protein
VSAKNGKGTVPPDPVAPEEAPGPASAEPSPIDDRPTPPDLRIAVSPAQAAVGFGIIASLILLVLRQRRKRG